MPLVIVNFGLSQTKTVNVGVEVVHSAEIEQAMERD
jgi:hypothetical protein